MLSQPQGSSHTWVIPLWTHHFYMGFCLKMAWSQLSSISAPLPSKHPQFILSLNIHFSRADKHRTPGGMGRHTRRPLEQWTDTNMHRESLRIRAALLRTCAGRKTYIITDEWLEAKHEQRLSWRTKIWGNLSSIDCFFNVINYSGGNKMTRL